MRVGIIIPDRGDRPHFMENCLRMLNAQTLKPEIIEIVNDPPESKDFDITKRYRLGYERLKNKGLDVIAFWENDDWYAPNYLEVMTKEWVKRGRPNIFGTCYTIFYHLKVCGMVTFEHMDRSSAMSTLILPNLNLTWCDDGEPYTDLHLWINLKLNKDNGAAVFKPEQHICMGMKHGDGLCGSKFHDAKLHRFLHEPDFNKDFLRATLDKESFDFYSNLYEREEVF